MKIDLEQADLLLTTTRAVRKRLDYDKPVPRDIIEDCIRVALQAPVGHRTWKQHFIVVRDPDQKMKIADVYRKGFYPYVAGTEAEADEAEAAGDMEKANLLRGNLSLAKYQADTMHQVPCLIIAAKDGRVDDATPYDRAAFYGSIYPSTWSLMLALRARGLGATFTTLHILNESDAAEALGIPSDVTQVAMLAVGYYTGETFKPGQRLPAADQIHWDEWGAQS